MRIRRDAKKYAIIPSIKRYMKYHDILYDYETCEQMPIYYPWYGHLECLDDFIDKENYDEIASGVGGTSGSHQRIDPKSIFSFSCPNVDIETIRNYNNKVEPLFYKIRNNQKQIQTLIQTRDGLLPRLMNKEISM